MLFTEAQAKEILEASRQQADFHKRLLPVVEQQSEDLKRYGANLGKTADRLDRLNDEYVKNHEPALKALRAEHGKTMEAVEKLTSAVDGLMTGQQKLVGTQGGTGDIRKSFGHKVISGAQYLEMKAQSGRGRDIKPIEVDDYKKYSEALDGKIIVKDFDLNNWGLQGSSLSTFRDIQTVDRLSEIFAEPLRQDRVRDYMPIIPVTGDAVEYWQQTDFVDDGNRPNVWSGNQARTVAEGGEKPYSTITGTNRIAPIRTLAHLFVISEQLMADAPAFARHVDTYMRGGLDEKEDSQLLKGSGSGSDIEGLMLRTGIQSFVQDTDSEVGDNEIDMIARGYSRIRKASHTPDTLLLGVGVATTLKLLKGNDGQYLWGSQATSGGRPYIWGLPLSETSALDDDEGVMGSFRMSVGLLDRMSTTLRVSDSHDNLFALNMVAMRYEKRIGLMVVRLKGIMKMLFNGRRES